MAARSLAAVHRSLESSIDESRRLASDAISWTAATGGGHPTITPKRRDLLTELAFLRAFQAWEVFLEDSFTLFVAGRTAPKGRKPHRYVLPPSIAVAAKWVVPEGRSYAEWTDPGKVADKAKRFFRDGRPFAGVLSGARRILEEARVIRNAIAHDSENAWSKFEKLVREKLAFLPPGLTVGSFLVTIVPTSAPPSSFLDHYLDRINIAASTIVPT